MMDLVVYVFAPRPAAAKPKARWWQRQPATTGWERAVKIDLAQPSETGNSYRLVETLVDTVVPCAKDANPGCFVAQGPTTIV